MLIPVPQASVSKSSCSSAVNTPLLGSSALPTPSRLAGASPLLLRGLCSFRLLLLLVAIAVQRAGGGSGGRMRGAGPELAASAWPRPIRSVPPRAEGPIRPQPGGAAGRAGSLPRGRPRRLPPAIRHQPGALLPRHAAVGRRPRLAPGRARPAGPARREAAELREARRRS